MYSHNYTHSYVMYPHNYTHSHMYPQTTHTQSHAAPQLHMPSHMYLTTTHIVTCTPTCLHTHIVAHTLYNYTHPSQVSPNDHKRPSNIFPNPYTHNPQLLTPQGSPPPAQTHIGAYCGLMSVCRSRCGLGRGPVQRPWPAERLRHLRARPVAWLRGTPRRTSQVGHQPYGLPGPSCVPVSPAETRASRGLLSL